MSNRFLSPKQLAKAALIGVMAITSTSAYAELLGYRFTDVHGEQRDVGPDQTYVNPQGDMTFYLRAGVDRRLEIELQDLEGKKIEVNTSDLIGANDRIQHGGGEHYGTTLTLSSPGDGEYRLVSRIISSSGAEIDSNQFPLTVIRQKPVLGEITIDQRRAHIWAGVEHPLIGSGRFNGLYVGIESSAVEISHAVFKATNVDTNQVHTFTSTPSEGRVGFTRGELLPNGNEGEYEIKANVFDVAGNVASTSITVFHDQSDGVARTEPTVTVGIYDPTNFTGAPLPGAGVVEGYVPYSPNISVSHNPIQLIFRVPRDNFVDYSPYGIGHIGNNLPHIGNTIVRENANYVYVKSANNFFANRHGTSSMNYRGYDRILNHHNNVVNWNLSNDSIIAPSSPNFALQYTDIGWSSDFRRVYNLEDRNGSITAVRMRFAARNYVQRVRVWGGGIDKSVTAAPGETEVIIPFEYNFYENYVSSGGTLNKISINTLTYGEGDAVGFNSPNGTYKDIEGDFTQAVINSIKLVEDKVVVNTFESDRDRTNGLNNSNFYRVVLNNSNAEVKDVNGVWHEISAIKENVYSQWDRDLVFNLRTAPEGRLTAVRVNVADNAGNIAKQEIAIDYLNDITPPVVDIISDSSISSLDDILIRTTDNIDQNPVVTNARISGGPANDDVNLATVRASGSVPTYSLEYPVIFPSMEAGEEYELEVTARDANGNETVERKVFSYKPTVVSLSTGDGSGIRIPARVAAFLRSDGGDVLQSEPLTLSGGAPVAGTYDVYATLRSDAEVPMIINGVRVTPGDTQEIMGQHNFSSTGGRLSIPVFPAEDGVVGTSTILVTTTAPNAPVLLVDIETWEGSADLTGSNWEPRQVIDPLSYIAKPTSPTYCRFTTRESESRQADPITNAACFLEWDRLPGELYPVERRDTEEAIPEVTGLATQQGPQQISYSLYMYDSKGTKVKVGGGSRVMNVVTALNSVVYASKEDYSAVNRVLHDFDVRLDQRSGPECQPTLTEGVARQAGERNGYNSTRRTCYFEWSQVPNGLSQNAGSDSPQLIGNISTPGEHTLSWKAYTFSPGGYRVAVAQQSEIITMVEPEAPTIELTSDYHHEGSTYIVPQNRNSLGGLIVDALPTDVRLDIKRGTEQVENEVFTAGWGARNRMIRNMRTDATPVWSETVHSVAAIYEKLPEIRTEADYNVVSAPSDSVQPQVFMDSTTILDTEPLKLTVQMRNMLDRDGEYVESEMGEWEVRLLNQQSYSNLEPMTELAPAVNGDVDFEVDMERLTDAGLRIVAEAHLVSPIEGYERIVTSRPTFVEVLRGGAIDGDVTSRQFSGPAPMTAVFQISLEDRLDQQALGDVVWQVSTDDGATWENQEIDPRRKMQFYNTFEEGEYQLRAFMVNGNSGAESYTETVEIVSYAQPEVEISGPTVLFVGDTHTYTADITLPETAVKSPEDAIVEWSLDGGDTWTHTGRELELFSDIEERFSIRARTRMPEAPELDRDAFNEGRIMVNFRDVVSPRVRVRSKTLLEEGNTYEISVSATAPYRGLEYDIKGYFTMPDGSTREGSVIEYVPTIADADAGSATFTYTAWVDGFEEETTSTDSSTSRVWQYVWPEFYFTERVSTAVAPADVSLSLRHRDGARNLDNPTYEWELPEGITELQERGGTTRLFQITEAGTHRITVNVKDERGHSSLLEQVIELGEPDPFDISLRYTPSNNYMREPLDVRLRPTYRGGHPRDRVSTQRFLVNGEVISEGANSGIATLNAGRHEIVFEIESNHGVQDQGSIVIDVLENQVPICELESSESSRNWIVRASCEDVDGRVSNYHWLVNGEENARTSNRLGILKRDYEDEMPSVVLIAVDDSGGASDPVSLP
ncbi:Ig-like domain-containing protein [Halomonas sp. KO116]|uniref:Ig-like domain-containing protein n=1 Tax=Halomonas sp. KO116 TaxID=1504981 RepID=UPI0004E37BA5|nr:Ig-like domain-containing protein [Halomonas sp. KO116]AJY53119.1 protein of unknown function DUF4165 [Halomonas sp. KO116]